MKYSFSPPTLMVSMDIRLRFILGLTIWAVYTSLGESSSVYTSLGLQSTVYKSLGESCTVYKLRLSSVQYNLGCKNNSSNFYSFYSFWYQKSSFVDQKSVFVDQKSVFVEQKPVFVDQQINFECNSSQK